MNQLSHVVHLNVPIDITWEHCQNNLHISINHAALVQVHKV